MAVQEKTDLLKEETIDLLLKDLDRLDQLESIRIEAQHGLEDSINDLGRMKKELAEGGTTTLLEACRDSVVDSISGQFGLASMFINAQDGGSVTTTHNFEQGVVANPDDQAKYDSFVANNNGSKEWSEARRETGYDKALPEKRKQKFKEDGPLIDDYNNREIHKDGRTHADHVVSAKEIESSAKNHLHMTSEERAKMACDESNIAFTDGRINQSKGEKTMGEFLDPESGRVEKYGLDREKMLKKDGKARKTINTTVDLAALKKYSNELLETGGKDAAKMVAYSAIGAIMKEFTQELFSAIKYVFKNRKTMSLKKMLSTFKERMAKVLENLKAKWIDIFKGSFEAGITAFFSNLLVFSINLFATTLKKFVSMIRAGFVSLVQAVKIIANPPAGMSAEEARFQAVKVLMAGLIGAASLGLSGAIEVFLQSIPGLQPLMMFPIPGDGRTVSDIVAVTLSALLGGVLTTTVLYLMDGFRRQSKEDKLQIQMVCKSGEIVEYSTMLSWLTLSDAYQQFFNDAREQAILVTETESSVEAGHQKVSRSASSFAEKISELKNRRN